MEDNKLLTQGIGKNLIQLTIPLLLGNILQQMYNTADSLIIGRILGTNAFAAVGMAGSIMNLFIFLLCGFCTGVSVLFGQVYGCGDYGKLRKVFFSAVVVGSIITAGLSLLFGISMPGLLMAIQTPEELTEYASAYLYPIIAGLIVTWFYNLFLNLLCALGDTRVNLYFLLFSVSLNVVADILLLSYFSMGVKGAAYATVSAQFVSAVGCIAYIRRKYPQILFGREDVGWHREYIQPILKYGCVSAMHQSSLYIGKLLIQGSVNTLGVSGITAYTATMRVEGFINSFGTSGAQSIAVLTAQNYGAGKEQRVQDTLKKGTLFLAGLSLSLGLFMFLFAKPSIGLFLESDQSQALLYGSQYLRIVAVFYLFNFLGNAFVGYFKGIGKVSVPLFGTMMHISVRVILSMLWISRLGLSAVAWASGIGWICVVCYMLLVYHHVKSSRYVKMHKKEQGKLSTIL